MVEVIIEALNALGHAAQLAVKIDFLLCLEHDMLDFDQAHINLLVFHVL